MLTANSRAASIRRRPLVEFEVMHGEPESSGGALAPRSSGASLEASEAGQLAGGAGLFDHADRDPFSRTAGRWTGLVGLLVVVIVAGWLVTANPSFATGKAGGTPNQLGEPVAAAQLAPGSPAAEGQALIATKPCVGCHTIPGVPGANGTVGPNLAGVASRPKIAGGAVNNGGPDDLKAWISNPPGLKPGTAMPNVGLTDDEATKIVAYLETLK
jgi:cytochrome c